jgi:hypothetical protein
MARIRPIHTTAIVQSSNNSSNPANDRVATVLVLVLRSRTKICAIRSECFEEVRGRTFRATAETEPVSPEEFVKSTP